MWTRAAFDLRQIRLADGPLHLPGDGANHFLLRHLAIQPAERAFDQAQVTNFFSEAHIAIRNKYIAICNSRQEKSNPSPCNSLFEKDIFAGGTAGGFACPTRSADCRLFQAYSKESMPALRLMAILQTDCPTCRLIAPYL